jgi:hypothetical protein
VAIRAAALSDCRVCGCSPDLRIGFILLPAALALNVVAFRRTAPPHGLIFWLGSVANATVIVVGVYFLALLAVSFTAI